MTTNPTIAKIGIEGSTIPPEGQRFIGPLTYDFSQVNNVDVNLRAQMEDANLMSFAMCAYIDSGANPNYVQLTVGQQIILVQGFSQGWYPVISERPIRYRISCSVGSGITTLFFGNFHVPAFQWPTR